MDTFTQNNWVTQDIGFGTQFYSSDNLYTLPNI